MLLCGQNIHGSIGILDEKMCEQSFKGVAHSSGWGGGGGGAQRRL